METATLSPAQVWDSIVESALTQASTTESASSRRALLLAPRPTVKHLPTVARAAAGIDPSLRATIRRLVAGEADWPLYLEGPPGTGKTCAALSLLDHAGGLYFTASTLCEKVIDAQQGRLFDDKDYRVFPEDFWKKFARAQLVVIDEIGCRERVSDFAYETLKRAIDERHGLPLVCITNLTLKAIGELYDARVVSRLACGTAVRLSGADRRLAR